EEIVSELLASALLAKKSAKWLRTLRQQLGRIAADFKGASLHALQPRQINAWLRSLEGRARPRAPLKALGLRSRANYRAAFQQLIRFAQRENYLDANSRILDQIENAAVPPVEIQIYTPE